MKKEYVAVYAGLGLFAVAFVTAALLHSAGHEHQSEIAIDSALILFGATMLVGLYSNVKNYGYFWTNVSKRDRTLSFDQLDEKYSRTSKGTKKYRVVITGFSLVAIATGLFGLVRLIKEIIK